MRKHKKLNILFLYFRYPLYPKGSYFQEFLNRLAESTEKIYLLASRYPKGRFKKAKNIKIIWLPLIKVPYLGELFFVLFALVKVVLTKNLSEVNIVNSVGPRGLLAGWYLKRKYNIPLVCTVEMINEKGSLINNLYYHFVRLLLTKTPVDKFICWSQYYWDQHLSKWGIPQDRVSIISGGIDLKKYNPQVKGNKIKEKYSPRQPLVVFAKPLYSTNTQAAKILVKSVAFLKPKLKVNLLVGGGEGLSEVKKLSEKLGVSSQVFFMPPTPFPKIPQYIAAADLIVLPFVYSPTTSRSLLEAMALGKPIITTPVGEIKRILVNKKYALLVNPSPQEIGRGISELLNNKQLASRLGKNAFSLVRKKFSLGEKVLETLSVLEKVCLNFKTQKN